MNTLNDGDMTDEERATYGAIAEDLRGDCPEITLESVADLHRRMKATPGRINLRPGCEEVVFERLTQWYGYPRT